jgi:hypothetical protein
MLNSLFSKDGCTDGFGVTLVDEYFSWIFTALGVYDVGFVVKLGAEYFSSFAVELGAYDVGFDSGKAFFNCLRSNGSASILYGGTISRRWMIFKPSAELNLSTTSRNIPGGSRISSSCWK